MVEEDTIYDRIIALSIYVHLITGDYTDYILNRTVYDLCISQLICYAKTLTIIIFDFRNTYIYYFIP